MTDQPLNFRSSSRSNNTGGNNCVQVADVPGGGRVVRDSKDTTGPTLAFTETEWTAFIGGVKDGEFD